MNSRRKNKPPVIAEKILRYLSLYNTKHSVLGDFEETFTQINKEDGVIKAQLWYWKCLLKTVYDHSKIISYWSIMMFNNYFKIALRNIVRNKLSGFLNITGLTLGLSCSLLIIFHIKAELSYEDCFPKADRIYRVIGEYKGENERSWAATSPYLLSQLRNEIPEIENSGCFRWAYPEILSYTDENGIKKTFNETKGYFADPEILNMFDIEFINGDQETALNNMWSIVLTERHAKKYYGDANPVGKPLMDDNSGRPYTITGVIKDMPENTHIQLDYLISMNSFRDNLRGNIANYRTWNTMYTYIMLPENRTGQEVESRIPDFTANYYSTMGTREEILARVGFKLQPVKDIHLNPNLEKEMSVNSDVTYIYIFGSVAFIILIIAIVNFVNISTAQALKRMKEVGVRKVLGAQKHQLVKQHLGEALLLTFISSVSAVLLFKALLPFYNNYTGKSISFLQLLTPANFLIILAIVLSIGVLAGIYPSVFISNFKPVSIVKGMKSSGSSAEGIKKGLLVFQFALTILMIFSTLVIFNQMSFIQEKNLGFDKDRVIAVSLYGDLYRNVVGTSASLKSELLVHSGISQVGTGSKLPGERIGVETFVLDGVQEDLSDQFARTMRIDSGFLDALGITLVSGRNFNSSTGRNQGYILNEAAVKAFNLDDPVGKQAFNNGANKGEIYGVIKDYNFASLHNVIEPLVLMYNDGAANYLFIKIKPGRIEDSLEYIKNKIEEKTPGYLFNYTFVDDRLGQLYQSEQVMSSIFRSFSILGVFISCLGLFGLANYSAELRTKEMGIRKVMGAKMEDIISLFFGEFLKWIILATIIAIPTGWVMMNNWLQSFAYKTSIGAGSIIISTLLAFFIALATISYQSIRSARRNPVDSIRYE